MKNTSEIKNEKWLKPWQRKALIVTGAIAGAVVAHMIMRWMERRKNKQATERTEDSTGAN